MLEHFSAGTFNFVYTNKSSLVGMIIFLIVGDFEMKVPITGNRHVAGGMFMLGQLYNVWSGLVGIQDTTQP